MNRQEKQRIIDAMKNDFTHAQASFVVNMQGMTVAAMQDLRREIYAKNGKIKIAKNTLLRRAAADVPGINDLVPYFKDQIAIVFALTEASAVAKVLYGMAQKRKHLALKVCVLDARLLTEEQITFLASLPSREVLLAQLSGTWQAPMRNFVSIINQLIVRLLWVLKEVEKKKQS